MILLAAIGLVVTLANSAPYTLSPPIILENIIRIRNVDTGLCLAVDGSDQHNAQFDTCSANSNLEFIVKPASVTGDASIKYSFQHGWTGLCLQTISLGAHPTLGACDAVSAKYSAIPDTATSPKFVLGSYIDGQKWCLFATPGGGASQGGCLGFNRTMYLERIDTVRLRNISTAKCLFTGSVDGQPAGTWGCWKDPAMAVRLESIGGADVRIKLVQTGKCLYVSTVNGGNVQGATCWADPNMTWVRENLGNNTARFRHKIKGTCIYTASANGAPVQHWPCWGDPKMVWSIDPF